MISFTWNNPNTMEYTPEETVIYRSETPFDAEELPEPHVVLPGAATSYIDDTAVDDVIYYYRVSFKLGIAEQVSRLITIKAPTSPDFFTTFLATSIYPFGRSAGVNNNGDGALVVDNFAAKWPVLVGEGAMSAKWQANSLKSEESLAVRLAAMIAIQKYRRSVWLTEGFTIVANTTILGTALTNANTSGWAVNITSGIPVGSKMTWREAFSFVAKVTGSMDICLNILYHLKESILLSLTQSRGRPVSEYSDHAAIQIWMDFVYGMAGLRCRAMPFRGYGEQYRSGSQTGVASYESNANLDPMPLLRLFAESFRNYPEIEAEFTITDQRTSLTYTNASDVSVDFFATAANANQIADPIGNICIASSNTLANTNILGPRNNGIQNELSLYPDSYGATSLSRNHNNVNGNDALGFFKTTTSNGRDFATIFSNTVDNGRVNSAAGMIWNKASAYVPQFTDGLSETDPFESDVVLRIIPELGLVDQSSRGTAIGVVGGVNMALHQSLEHASPGFPGVALAPWGSDPAGIGTIHTDLDMAGYIMSGTPFTIEMFLSMTWNNYTGNLNANNLSLIELGVFASGSRLHGVNWDAANNMFTFGHHTNNGASRVYYFAESHGAQTVTSGTFNQYNGNNHFHHIALQYDPISQKFYLFIDGVIRRVMTTFIPTAAGRLAFLGCLDNTADLTTQRQYSVVSKFTSEMLIHEIVVTRQLRYNYANFIGKVPFARKRF